MSGFKWSEHAECPTCRTHGVRQDCESDRALLIAEGVRLTERLKWAEGEMERLRKQVKNLQATHELPRSQDIAKIDRLRSTLELTLETHDQGHSPCSCVATRAALGEAKP